MYLHCWTTFPNVFSIKINFNFNHQQCKRNFSNSLNLITTWFICNFLYFFLSLLILCVWVFVVTANSCKEVEYCVYITKPRRSKSLWNIMKKKESEHSKLFTYFNFRSRDGFSRNIIHNRLYRKSVNNRKSHWFNWYELIIVPVYNGNF